MEQSNSVHHTLPTNQIFIESPLAQNLVSCFKVTVSPVFAPTKKQPNYLLLGVDKITIFVEHTPWLGWYKTGKISKKKYPEPQMLFVREKASTL